VRVVPGERVAVCRADRGDYEDFAGTHPVVAAIRFEHEFEQVLAAVVEA
jgi:hypothetical protein